jgi:hypothetical protein
MTECPWAKRLPDFLDGHLPGEEINAVVEHVETCTQCQEELERISTHSHAETSAAPSAESFGDFDVKEMIQRVGSALNREDLLSACFVPGYELRDELGRGGMGVVWEAIAETSGQKVAVKFLTPGLHGVPEAIQRFSLEAATSFDHPNIAKILDRGRCALGPFLVSELVDGGNLALVLSAVKPWDAKVAAQFVRILALAIHFAHQRGVIHRDLKPANILLDHVESAANDPYALDIPSVGVVRPKITDFGVAKRPGVEGGMTASGDFLGTVAYAAPECVRQGSPAATAASDVYSLAAILYELLTARRPHEEDTVSLTKKHLKGDLEVPPPRSINRSIPEELELICMHALAAQPANRYASAADLALDLECFLTGKPTMVRAPGRIARLMTLLGAHPSFVQFHGLRPLIFVAGGLGAAITIFFYWLHQENAPTWLLLVLDVIVVALVAAWLVFAWWSLPRDEEAKDIFWITTSTLAAWFLIMLFAKIYEARWNDKNVGWPFQSVCVAQGSFLLARRLGRRGRWFYFASGIFLLLAFVTAWDRERAPLWATGLFACVTITGFAVRGRRRRQATSPQEIR